MIGTIFIASAIAIKNPIQILQQHPGIPLLSLPPTPTSPHIQQVLLNKLILVQIFLPLGFNSLTQSFNPPIQRFDLVPGRPEMRFGDTAGRMVIVGELEGQETIFVGFVLELRAEVLELDAQGERLG